MNPTRWTLVGCGLSLLWLALAFFAMPWMIDQGFQGRGPLAALMGDRATHGLAFYQDAWSQIALEASAFGVVMGAVLLTLIRRGELEQHWFAPASARDLATVRIVLVALQLFLLLPPPSYGCSGCDPGFSARLAELGPAFYESLPSLDGLLAPFGSPRPDAQLLHGVWLASLAGGVLALIGLWTRAGLLTLAWGSTVLVAHSYSFREYHHPEALFLLALWVLALAPIGPALSLDALIRRVRATSRSGRFDPEAGAPRSPLFRWPLTLIMWLVAITYLDAGLSKLTSGGLAWLDGDTLAHYFARDGLARGHALGIWLAGHPWLLSPMAVGALLFELSFFAAVLYPRLAPFYVVAGIGMHTGIYVVHGPLFLQTMSLYVVFLEPVRARLCELFAAPPDPLTLIYDGGCRRCRRTMAVFDEVAAPGRLRFVNFEDELVGHTRGEPEELRHALHAVLPGGQVVVGFEALTALARALPVLWPLRPLLVLARATGAGSALDQRAAARRRELGCRSATCML